MALNPLDEALPELLAAWRSGDDRARELLVARLLPELRALAERQLHRLGRVVSMHPSDLVQESIIELLRRGASSKDLMHLRALLASVVRTTLIDYLRLRNAAKRGRNETDIVSISLLNRIAEQPLAQLDLIAVHQAMQALSQHSVRAANIVEMKVFGGMSEQEMAEVLGLSRATVSRDWAAAKLWLARALTDSHSSERPLP